MSWWVYMLRCTDGSLYTGITTNVERRTAQHNAGAGAKYTRSRRPVVPVFWEEWPTKGEALRREAAIKRLHREEKLKLIQMP